MKPSSALRSPKPLIELDDLSWQAHCFEKKKRRLHRKMMKIQYQTQTEQIKFESQQSARRDWMIFCIACISITAGIAWIVFQSWMQLPVLQS
jgi:uncharacterized membrane protein YbaN (DUF454 family)